MPLFYKRPRNLWTDKGANPKTITKVWIYFQMRAIRAPFL
nr:MAG TPA: hypothetical protein [Caudoviricetes sp.]